MEFNLSQESNLEGEKNLLVISFANDLREYFDSKNYGIDIQHFYIGVVCVKPEFESFFKVRKPRYKSVEKIKLLDETTIEKKGVFSYDIKLNFNEFVNSSNEESNVILATEIIKSLSFFDNLSKKVKDFDREKFKEDFNKYFEKMSLM